jgi:hypothetical protein
MNTDKTNFFVIRVHPCPSVANRVLSQKGIHQMMTQVPMSWFLTLSVPARKEMD